MKYLVLGIIILSACKQPKNQMKSLPQIVEGNWFVVYPDDNLLNERQQQIYATIQDSITDLKCLKLVSFTSNGDFIQLDNNTHKGKWGTKDNEYLLVNEGGYGFEKFKAVYTGYSTEDSVLKLTETIKAKGQELRFIWNLKRMDKKANISLFKEEMNVWREKPLLAETTAQVKERLSQMLNFYAEYFRLISEEASYFMPERVHLPLKFYQHAIGLKEFRNDSKFAAYFYSEEQAEEAYRLLGTVLKEADFDKVKGGNSYTLEYSQMLRILAAGLAI